MESSVMSAKRRKLDGHYDDLSREELIETIHRLENVIEHLKKSATKSGCNVAGQGRSIDFSKYGKRHIALKILYLGWDYDGFVVQDNTANTIEYHLFEALMKGRLIENRASCNYHRCGRTDQGVSSYSQVVSLTVRSRSFNESNDHDELPYCRILNGLLPKDIRVLAWASVTADFSARFSCTLRTYKYWFPRGDLNIDKMNQAIQSIVGQHDFRNLCKMDVANGVVDFRRRIHTVSVSISKNCVFGRPEFDMCEFTITGEAFLWHQIRAIISVLFLIGQGKENIDIFEKLLDVENYPRKPQYNLASPLPLNLFKCEFEDIEWLIDQDSLTKVISSLQSYWTCSAIKCSMLEAALKDCEQSSENIIPVDFYSALFKDNNSKIYRPLMSRPTAQSLEDRITHYVSKGRLKLKSTDVAINLAPT